MRLNRILQSSFAWACLPALCVALTLGAVVSKAQEGQIPPAKETKTITEKKTVTTVTETKTVIENGVVVSETESSHSSENSQNGDTSNLAKDLVGTWIMESSANSDSGVGKRLKSFTGTHWMITQANDSGTVVFHHGGTYKVDGDVLIEETDFANQNTVSLIGKPRKLKMTVERDTMKQYGLDNIYTETWKRMR